MEQVQCGELATWLHPSFGATAVLSTLLLESITNLISGIIDLLLAAVATISSSARGRARAAKRPCTGCKPDCQAGRGRLAAGYCDPTPAACVKRETAHEVFPLTEKVLRIRFDLGVAG